MAARMVSFLSALPLVAAVTIPDSAATKIIYKDVVILGGGASGSHAAVRLREDYNKTIIIVEKQNRIVCSDVTKTQKMEQETYYL